MMKTSDNSYAGFRCPTAEELYQISSYFEVYYISHIKLVKTLSRISCVAGLFFLGSLGFNSDVSIASIVLGVICFIIMFYCIKTKNYYNIIISDFKSGKFIVMDGRITKSESSYDNTNCVNVWFTSLTGTHSEGWYKVRKEFAPIGSSIILVYSTSNNARKTIKMAFTPFMLTEEGIKLQH